MRNAPSTFNPIEALMSFLQRSKPYVVLVVIMAVTGAYAQISTVNSVTIQPRVFNDVPGATFTPINAYPGFIAFSESGVSAPTGFANRDVWRLSANGGTSPYALQPNDYFTIAMDLNLTGNPITPRKEAGFLFSTGSSGDIQFIVNTDGHEVVQFGGISTYSFSTQNGLTYNSGNTISLSMTYFLDSNNKNALVFVANNIASPVFEFPTGTPNIGSGSTLGGYLQVVNDPNNANNGGTALFSNIRVTNAPEPSVFALLGGGLLALIVFRRRR
jgi:hypothetical protein